MQQPDWSVEIVVEGSGPGPEQSSVESLLEILADRSPVASYRARRYSVRFLVGAEDPAMAIAAALKIFKDVAKVSRLPDWPIVHAEASTIDELERENLTPNYPELLGVKELAELLCVSKQRVWELRNIEGFPKPLTTLASTPVWTESSVQHFLQEWKRRPGRPRKAAAG